MPPEIIELLITATGAGFEWLKDTASLLLHATPDWGLRPLLVVVGFSFVILMGWDLINERR